MMKRRTHVVLVSLLSLSIAACVFWYLTFLRESYAPAEIAIREVSNSEAITKALGSPIKTRYVTGRILSGADYGNADLTIHVAGPRSRGTLFEWAQNGFAGWHICSLRFVDESGNAHTLVSDETTTCERE